MGTEVIETVLAPVWIIVPSEGVAVRCWYEHSHAMSFRVYRAAQSFSIGSTEGTWILMQGGDILTLDEWEKAKWELDGAVKWDGCIDWQTNPKCMAHGCGPSTVDWVTAVFTVVYAVAKRSMDLLGDEVRPLPEGYVEIVDHNQQAQLEQRKQNHDNGNPRRM